MKMPLAQNKKRIGLLGEGAESGISSAFSMPTQFNEILEFKIEDEGLLFRS